MRTKIALLIGCLFCLAACQGSNPVPIPSYEIPDLSGYYLIVDGTETFAEAYQGQHRFFQNEFTPEDETYLLLSQNGSVMEMFHCMGQYVGDSVVCDFTEPIQWEGHRGVQKVDGSILFDGETVIFDVWIHREYPTVDYVSNNVLKLTLRFSGEVPKLALGE
jgi:hypothetical protein